MDYVRMLADQLVAAHGGVEAANEAEAVAFAEWLAEQQGGGPLRPE